MIGEHVGSVPTTGTLVVINDGVQSVTAVVGGLERFQHRDEQGNFVGHSWGLLLRGITLDDVRIGAVVSADESGHRSA